MCNIEFPHFGASYPDAHCINGYLWDMDSYEDGGYTIGGDDPCPFCNTEEWLKTVLDNEDFESREKALAWVEKMREKWGAEHAKIDVTDFCKPIDPGIAQCIADHSWEMLGEDEKPIPKDLEEAAKKYATEWHENPDGSAWKPYFEVSAIKAFIAGAKWQADHTPLPEDTVLFNKGVAEGRRLAEEEQADLFTIVALDAAQRAREQMLKEAVEGEVESFSDMHQEVTIPLNPTMFKVGDKVRIIILPKED